MSECYIHLKCFNHARITLNVLLKMTSKNATWREKVQRKLEELLILTSQTVKDPTDSSSNLGNYHVSSLLAAIWRVL